MYRLNFGNGQVHGEFKTLAQAKRELVVCGDGKTYIQRYTGDGEWSRVRKEQS